MDTDTFWRPIGESAQLRGLVVKHFCGGFEISLLAQTFHLAERSIQNMLRTELQRLLPLASDDDRNHGHT